MPTKAKRISSKIFAVLCAVTVLLGVFVLSTSAQEPTERSTADNPYGYGYEPITEPYLYRIPVTLSTSYDMFNTTVNRQDFVGDDIAEFEHNLAWLSITYEGQNENGDISLYTVRSPFLDCYYLYSASTLDITTYDPYECSVFIGRGGVIEYRIPYGEDIPYPDSIVEAYVYIGVNPLRYGYDSNTSGGNTEEAYQNGYTYGYDTGYTEGYNNGYGTASSEIENQNALGLFGRGILDGILDIYFDTFRIPIFGTSLGEIIGYFLFFLWVLLIVKIVSFVI